MDIKDSLYSIDKDIARLERMIINLSANLNDLQKKVDLLENVNYMLRQQLSYTGLE